MSQPGHETHDGSTGAQPGGADQQSPQGYDQAPQGYGPPAHGYSGDPAGYGQDPYGQAGYGSGAAAPGWPAQQGGTPTLDQPHYGIKFVDAVKRVFQKYARFDGRASRSEYWWYALAIGIVYIVLASVYTALGGTTDGTGSMPAAAAIFAVLVLLVLLAAIVPTIAVSVRRLHDAGFSGWLYLLNLVPYVGGLVVLVLLALPSKPEGARFDKRPAGPGYYQG